MRHPRQPIKKPGKHTMQEPIKHKPDTTFIYGAHAVEEAVVAKPEAVRRILTANSRDQKLMALFKQSGKPMGAFDPKNPPKGLPKDITHQGIIAEVDPSKLMVDYASFMHTLSTSEHTLLLVLGELHDPQNVGAIIRNAGAFGVSGVLIPEHRQAPVTGAVVKVSAGMAFRVPLVSIGNVNTTLKDLKDAGFWIYGLSGEEGTPIEQEDFSKPSVLVIGAEGDGIREKTLETCDIALRIPIHPRCESLNAAVAAAIAMHAWSLKHKGALR